MLVTGFESFNLAMYLAASREVELMLEPASVDILVFSGRVVFVDRKSQLDVSYLSLSPWLQLLLPLSPSPLLRVILLNKIKMNATVIYSQ